jgi:hypothetical protein
MTTAIDRPINIEPITSAKIPRYIRREEFSKVFAQALDSIEPPMSQEQIAYLLGTKQAIINYFRDPKRKDSLHACDIPALPRKAAVHILEELANKVGYTLAMIPDFRPSRNHLSGLSEVTKEAGEVGIAYALAMADGYISRQESEQIETEARDAMRVLASLIDRMRMLQRRGGERVVEQI